MPPWLATAAGTHSRPDIVWSNQNTCSLCGSQGGHRVCHELFMCPETQDVRDEAIADQEYPTASEGREWLS